MFMRHFAAGMLLCCLATASLAQQANPNKWYVDLGVGESTLDHEPGFTDIDDKSTSYSFRVGYKFARFFALEAGYVDVGDFSSTVVPTCSGNGPCPPTIYEKSSLDAFLLNSRFIWPIANHFQLNASLGALYYQHDTWVGVDPDDLSRGSFENGSFSYGVGIAVPVNDRFEIGLDYSQYFDLGVDFNFFNQNPSIESDTDARVITLDLRFRF